MPLWVTITSFKEELSYLLADLSVSRSKRKGVGLRTVFSDTLRNKGSICCLLH